MIFSDADYHHAIVEQLMSRPKQVWISSFNFNSGISDRGTLFQRSQTFQLLDDINRSTKNSRVLIGLPSKIPERFLAKLTNTAEFFNNIEWRFRSDLHLKTWIFFRPIPIALFGGRNLGDSSWADASVFLSQKDSRALQGFYDSLWSGAEKVHKTKFKLLT